MRRLLSIMHAVMLAACALRFVKAARSPWSMARCMSTRENFLAVSLAANVWPLARRTASALKGETCHLKICSPCPYTLTGTGRTHRGRRLTPRHPSHHCMPYLVSDAASVTIKINPSPKRAFSISVSASDLFLPTFGIGELKTFLNSERIYG